MAISTVQNPNAVVQTNNKPVYKSAEEQGKMGKEDFMKLLIAQLKNQDPNSPVDAKEFVTQLSQLTSVETLNNMGSSIKSLLTATTGMVNNQAGEFVGKRIEADGKKLFLGEQGNATSGINLPTGAEKVTVTIRDANGQPVQTVELGRTKIGVSSFSWDGKDASGTRAAAGQYTMTVDAKDAKGNPVQADTQISGVVNQVTYEQGFPELVVGDARVALANITSIKQ